MCTDLPAPHTQVVLPASLLQSEPSLLPSLPTVLLLSHYHEDLSWLTRQPYPAIIYEKKPPLSMQGQRHSPVSFMYRASHREGTEMLLLLLPATCRLPQTCTACLTTWRARRRPTSSSLSTTTTTCP